MNSQAIINCTRFKKTSDFSADHPLRPKNNLSALEIYTKVAEFIASQEGNQNNIGFSQKSQKFLQKLQKTLFGKPAVNTEE
jgi:hypothetical protein